MPREQRFALPGLTLAAEIWGAPGEQPILASHGWLDNAGSFELLAPLLPGCELVALDLAGHGLSDSRSADSSYNIWQDVGDLLDVADAMAWQRCTLLGHSRGAGISMLFAATFPERVDKLILLEGGLPLTAEAEEAPAGLAEALRDARALRGKGGRVFASARRRSPSVRPVFRRSRPLRPRCSRAARCARWRAAFNGTRTSASRRSRSSG